MKHMMIDIETLGKYNRAVVMQVGVAVFDPGAVDTVGRWYTGDEAWEWNVDIDSCLKLGGRVDDSTVRWWLRESPEARASVAFMGQSIRTVLDQTGFRHRWDKCERVWCHGATFDVPILEHYYRECGVTPPWKYHEVRDTRTLFELAEQAGWVREKRETAHTARADAWAQAQDVQLALAHLRGGPALDRHASMLHGIGDTMRKLLDGDTSGKP
jgi:hypothetical protein